MKHASRSKVHSPSFISINFHKELWKHIICQLAQIRITPSRQFARWKIFILSSEPSCHGSPWGSFAALRQIGGNHSRTTTENPILYTILHPTGRNQGGGIFKAAGISYLPSVYREVIENTDFNHKGHVQDWFTLNWLPTDSNIDMWFFGIFQTGSIRWGLLRIKRKCSSVEYFQNQNMK